MMGKTQKVQSCLTKALPAKKAAAVLHAGLTEVLVTRCFGVTATFGSVSLTASGYNNVYAAKLNPYGNWLWAIKAGGTGGNIGMGIHLDGTGNACVTGHFMSTAYFGSLCLTTNGYSDIFVAKLGIHPGAGIPIDP